MNKGGDLINEVKISTRLKRAWDVFREKDALGGIEQYGLGPSSYTRPDRMRFTRGNERSIVNSIYNWIAIDACSCDVLHSRLDEEDNFKYRINSGLNECLTVSGNTDQTGRALIQDIIMSMFDEGVVAVVPVETFLNPTETSSYDILQLRTGRIISWYPKYIRVSLYDENVGYHKEITIEKKNVAIIENPLYSIMNEPNSTIKRLIRKLNILDAIDEQSGAGKLDMIIQLPYALKSELKQSQAEKRRNQLSEQLRNSQYGIGYIDATEHITQLNRPIDNNLLSQIQYLTNMMYNQLGLSEEIFNGTADEASMLNYYNRSIAPVLDAITEEMTRKFLTKTARTQKQKILWFNDPFKFVPIEKLADIADKFTRNEIMSPNEMRSKVGMKPSEDPAANELRNRNINQANAEVIEKKEEKHEESEV